MRNKLRRTWREMIARCENKKHHSYKDYGGRGIKVCKEWHIYENFLSDMGEKPEGLSLDRINNDKGYSKENCKWSTITEQNRNKRSVLMFKGECAQDASLRLGTYKDLVGKRLRRGWDIEKAFTIPAKHK